MDLRRDGVRLLTAIRVGVGVSMLARPALLPRLMGVDKGTAARVSWLPLMVGAREVALGAGTYAALASGGDARWWLAGSAASDAVDAAAFGRAVRRGHVQPVLGALVALTAAGSAVAGAAGAAGVGRDG
jgi:hypothetical protein